MICLFYKVIIGTAMVGITTGIVGCFMLLNKQSMLGDTIAHATLPGLTGMFLIVQEKSLLLLLFGAALSGLAGIWCVDYIWNNTQLKKDTALGIILSTFFGTGIILLTIIQKLPIGSKSGLTSFLFGHAATILDEDIILISILSLTILAIVGKIYKELVIIIFDRHYAISLDISVKNIERIFCIVMVLTVIMSLSTVGIIVMSSFLISPAIGAQQITTKLKPMIIVAIILSLVATTTGTIISFQYSHIPTGPTIVIIATSITAIIIMIQSIKNYIIRLQSCH